MRWAWPETCFPVPLRDCGTLWAVMFPWTGWALISMQPWACTPSYISHMHFVNLLNPIYGGITACLKRNVFWADGAYTSIFGKTTMRKAAICASQRTCVRP